MTAYYMLMASLPRHDRQFTVKDTPISELQLKKRLTLLSAPDKQTVNETVRFVWDSRFSGDISLESVLHDAKKLLALNNVFINNLVQWHLDVRSLLTALQFRRSHKTPPAKPIWHSRLNNAILSRWNQADFGMKGVLPWFPGLAKKFAENETDSLENMILDVYWRYLNILEAGHYFDLEAVIIYLLRWHIVRYWSEFNGDKALDHINTLAGKAVRAQPSCKHFYKVINHE